METKTIKPGQNIPNTYKGYYYYAKFSYEREAKSLIKKEKLKRGQYVLVFVQVERSKTLWEMINSNYKSKRPKYKNHFYVIFKK